MAEEAEAGEEGSDSSLDLAGSPAFQAPKGSPEELDSLDFNSLNPQPPIHTRQNAFGALAILPGGSRMATDSGIYNGYPRRSILPRCLNREIDRLRNITYAMAGAMASESLLTVRPAVVR